MANFIFIDKSGDPGKPYEIDDDGNKKPTGGSLFYILSAVHLDSSRLFILDQRMTEIKNKFGFKKEIKSESISLPLYSELLDIVNELDIKIFYRLIDKTSYKGKFAVSGNKKLHNVFDEYNLVKTVFYAIKRLKIFNVEVILDRAERRLLDGKFDNFNNYLVKKLNTKTIKRVSYVTHINSEYVYAMQMSDLIAGVLKDDFNGKNKELKKKIIKNLVKIW